MNPKLVPFLLFILVAVMAVPLAMRLGKARKADPVTIARLELGSGRVVRVTVEANSQQTLSLHYHVDINDQPQIEHAFFGTLPRTSPPPSFVIHSDEAGDLIGIAQATVPNRIIILHDFTTGESWPMRIVTYKDSDTEQMFPYYEEKETIVARGEALFERLEAALPDKEFELLRTMSTRPLTIPEGQFQLDEAEPGEAGMDSQ